MRAVGLITALLLGSCELVAAQTRIPTQPAPCPDYALAIPVPPANGLVDRGCYSFQAVAGEQVKAMCSGSGQVGGYAYDIGCQVAIGPEHGNAFAVSGASHDWINYTFPEGGTFILQTLFVGRQSFFAAESFQLELVALPTCVPDANALCPAGRFRVTADWQAADGTSGHGTAVGLTGEAGSFSFFDASNVELVAKVHDACDLNQKWWVFAGGLTDVQVTLTVTDTANGGSQTYSNRSGVAFPPIQDTAAFPCP